MSEQPSPHAVSGRVAGIDYGTVRLGIAISDRDRKIASPHENYTRRDRPQDARRLLRLREEESITLWVVGLPVHLDGRESQKSREARQFGQWLGEITGQPVVFFDERFTSLEAEQFLLEAQMTRKRRKSRMDMLAAQIMLAAWLESQGKSQQPPGSLDD